MTSDELRSRLACLGVLGTLAVPYPLRTLAYHFGRVTAPSEADETDAAYLAKTPLV